MPKNINLDPVLRLVAGRLIEDRQRLSRLLDVRSSEDFRDFDEQERLLESIQAAVRALDILEGRVSPDNDQPPTSQVQQRRSTWISWLRLCGRTEPGISA